MFSRKSAQLLTTIDRGELGEALRHTTVEVVFPFSEGLAHVMRVPAKKTDMTTDLNDATVTRRGSDGEGADGEKDGER